MIEWRMEIAKKEIPVRKSALLAALSCAAVTFCFAVLPAHAGSVSILNCFGQQIRIGAYNSNDGLMAIAYKDACVSAEKSATINCATSQCKIKLWNGCSASIVNALTGAPMSGSQVYYNGQLYDMKGFASLAVERGIARKGTTALTCSQVTKLMATR